MARLHFPASKLAQATKEKAKKESSPATNSQVPKPNPESMAKKSRGPKPNSESTTKKSQLPKPNPDSLAEKSPEPKPDSEQPELILNSHSLQEIGTA
ncbi:hypothetical protein A2U01_0027835 [Trifolium medium]|uniref:Uncharacterized protein n=1 Tax=Trifolium medium TaxID=97028 RepID=A0A392P7B5_9FABA|nr:hypothetical protein [Trifolium medium]